MLGTSGFGQAMWYYNVISEAKTLPDAKEPDVTVENEAFMLLLYDNCIVKWKKTWDILHNGKNAQYKGIKVMNESIKKAKEKKWKE